MEAVKGKGAAVQQLQQAALLLQVFQFCSRGKGAGKHILVQRGGMMNKKGKVNNTLGVGAVKKFRRFFSVFQTAATAGNARHHMGAIS